MLIGVVPAGLPGGATAQGAPRASSMLDVSYEATSELRRGQPRLRWR
jgi:hypothetical protein